MCVVWDGIKVYNPTSFVLPTINVMANCKRKVSIWIRNPEKQSGNIFGTNTVKYNS